MLVSPPDRAQHVEERARHERQIATRRLMECHEKERHAGRDSHEKERHAGRDSHEKERHAGRDGHEGVRQPTAAPTTMSTCVKPADSANKTVPEHG